MSQKKHAKTISEKPSGPWRSVDSMDSLSTSPVPGCSTIDDLFERAAKLWPNKKCLGTRPTLSEEEERQADGRILKKVVQGEYQWQTFVEVSRRVNNFGSGLLALGQQPRSRLVIFAETRAEWMIAAQACLKYNFPMVTLYATLGQEAIIHGITETEASFVITSQERLCKFNGVLHRMPSVTHVVVMDVPDGNAPPTVTGRPDNVTILSMQTVEMEGAKPDNMERPISKPTRDDVAVIMYTSGSTGLPKGVIMCHGNLMCGMSGQGQRIPDLGKREDDVLCGYLPLAHVLELTCELTSLSYGIPIGYSSPFTLTDKSSKIKTGCKGDISVLQPTLLAAVPVVMDRMYKGCWDKINSGSVIKRAMFHFAYNYKLRQIEKGNDTPLLNTAVFRAVAETLGGRVRVMLCGGAPLSAETQNFMRICFSCPILQGYGLTETAGAGTITDATDLKVGRVGAPITCCEVRLRDWEEGGYTSGDLPYPRGEILLGGGNVTKGYYNLDQLTEETFININGVRYFCTGDIGHIEHDGVLKIIDRKKDLVKLQMGEYVSLGKVETVIKMSRLVEQVCVVAHSDQTFVVCLLVPNEKQVRLLLENQGIETMPEDFTVLCKDPKTVKAVTIGIREHAAASMLEKFEIPQRFTLCPEPWLPDTDLLTSSFKLKRKSFEVVFRDEIVAMYTSVKI